MLNAARSAGKRDAMTSARWLPLGNQRASSSVLPAGCWATGGTADFTGEYPVYDICVDAEHQLLLAIGRGPAAGRLYTKPTSKPFQAG